MSGITPGWEELNAYVDGELAPHEAAEVARRLADDPALADQMALLTQLKAATNDMIEEPGLVLPEPRRRRLPWVVVAAALAASLIVAALAGWHWRETSSPPWLARAWVAHGHWVASDVGDGGQPDRDAIAAGVVLARLHQLDLPAEVPDLSAARLTLSHIETFAMGEGGAGKGGVKGLQVGYVGTRSCHVSLMIFPVPDGFTEGEVEYRDGRSRAFAWRVGPLAYTLVASGMDEPHLTLIARVVRQATIDHRALDGEARTALRYSRSVARPCLT